MALADLIPVLSNRDRQFFELAVTLIPIFFLTGAVASAARGVQVLVSGNAGNFDRYFVLTGLVLAFSPPPPR